MEWENLIAPTVIAAVVAALVSGGISVWATIYSRNAIRKENISDKAWADYELRRDVYLNLAKLIDCLFENGDASRRPDFHQVARQTRLIGSDDVVNALNDFTNSITNGEAAEPKYSELFNAMRRDIRTLHTMPPEGTSLEATAFPIEN